MFAIESEMSKEERELPENKYWTKIDDERYLQVEEVDEKCFQNADDEDDADNGDETGKNNEHAADH